MTRTGSVLVLLVVAVAFMVAAPRSAGAQPAEAAAERPASPEEAAAAAFERGQRSFEEDDYAAALAAFEEAQRLAPSDVVRFNIGLCLERLARFREASVEYEHASDSEELDAATRTNARERGDRVRARLGTVVVPGPAGATVEVVGVESCTAPCRIVVDPGTYTVRRTDGTEGSRSVTIGRGQESTASFELEDLPPPPPPPPGGQEPGRGLRLGLVGWIGGGVAVVGAVATIVLGLQAESLHDDYLAHPNRDDLDAGRAAVVGTNVALVFALLGAASVAVDLLLLDHGGGDEGERPAPSRLSLAF